MSSCAQYQTAAAMEFRDANDSHCRVQAWDNLSNVTHRPESHSPAPQAGLTCTAGMLPTQLLHIAKRPDLGLKALMLATAGAKALANFHDHQPKAQIGLRTSWLPAHALQDRHHDVSGMLRGILAPRP